MSCTFCLGTPAVYGMPKGGSEWCYTMCLPCFKECIETMGDLTPDLTKITEESNPPGKVKIPEEDRPCGPSCTDKICFC